MPATVTLTTATAERLQRAAELLQVTPEALAERIVALVLVSCDQCQVTRSFAFAELCDLRGEVFVAGLPEKGEQG